MLVRHRIHNMAATPAPSGSALLGQAGIRQSRGYDICNIADSLFMLQALHMNQHETPALDVMLQALQWMHEALRKLSA